MKFGAFVQLNKIQGLVHVSELSHHRITNVEDVVTLGQEIEVKVISKKNGKIGLSMKALQKTPWEIYAETHKPGDEVQGKIVRKMATGMLVEVAKDVVGIINKKDYSWDPKENLAGEVEVGSELNLKILSMEAKKRRMSLSKKHLEYNPWKDVTVKVGEEVSGTVEELQSRGALVKVQGVKAFLPIGEIKEERVNEIAQVLKVEDVIKAVVTKLDKEDWNMVISIKQLEETKQRAEFEDYLETEESVSNPTLGDLFKDELEKFKK
jgi:small subunit ribosomal protein S1